MVAAVEVMEVVEVVMVAAAALTVWVMPVGCRSRGPGQG